MTDAELLVEIDAAILAVLQRGQEYSILGRSYRRGDLKELRAWRKEVAATIARAARGSALGYGVPVSQ